MSNARVLHRQPVRVRRPRRKVPTVFDLVTLLIAAVLIGVVVVPLIRVVTRLFWVDGSFTLAPIERTLAIPNLANLILDTLILVVASSILAFVIGVVLAWLNERTDARMGLLTDAFPLLPFLLPPVAGAVGWTMLLSPRAGLLNHWIRDVLGMVGIQLDEGPFNINSWYGLILVMAFYAVPFVFMNASAGLRNLDPALEEASRLSGAGVIRTLYKVTLPAVAPSLGAGFLLCVWFGTAMFSIPAIIGTPAGIQVISVQIVEYLTFSYPPRTDEAIGLSAFVLLLVGGAYMIQLRILRRGTHAMVGGKGGRAKTVALGAWRLPARLLVLLYVLVSTILPVIALVLVSLNGFWTPNINWGNLSFEALRRAVFDDRMTLLALGNSLWLGVVTAFVGTIGAAMIALYVARRRTALAKGIDAAIKLPASISNMVIAVGILLLLAGAPFYLSGTLMILFIGYLALYLPQASIAADAAVSGIAKELPEASAVSGASEWTTFVKVYLPLMTPGLVAGWAMLFIRIVGDLTASAILAGTSNPVVGSRIYEVFTGGSYALLASLSTVLVLITGIVLVLVLAYTRRASKLGIVVKVGGV